MDESHIARELMAIAGKLAGDDANFLTAFKRLASRYGCVDVKARNGIFELKKVVASDEKGEDVVGYVVRGEFMDRPGGLWFEANFWVGVVGEIGIDLSSESTYGATIPNGSEALMERELHSELFKGIEEEARDFMSRHGRKLREFVPGLVGGV
jgi:hypothetical protein